MTLKTKWIEIIYNLATSSRKIRNFFTPLGASIYALVIFLFIVIAIRVDRLIGVYGIFPKLLSIILAFPLFLTVFIFIGWSVLTFLRAKGSPVPINPPPKLVTNGPYAYVRNPMLTGVFALVFGMGVLLGSASLLVIFIMLLLLKMMSPKMVLPCHYDCGAMLPKKLNQADTDIFKRGEEKMRIKCDIMQYGEEIIVRGADNADVNKMCEIGVILNKQIFHLTIRWNHV